MSISNFGFHRAVAGLGWVGLAALVSLTAVPSFAESGVKASTGNIEIPTYPWWPAVKHPYFRGTDKANIYPYPMLDNLVRKPETRVWQTVVLENECLRVTFLPELGGKIYEVWDKTENQPMFYVNHVAKPGLIGQCGAWISGGVEFNTGPAGHTVSAVQPVEVTILPPAADGSRSAAVGETERIYGTRWTVVVTLRPGRSFLEETVRIYNRTETVRPYYFWNCTAMANTPGFCFIYPMTLGTDHGGIQFYTWPIADGKDLSRGVSYEDASSIFAWDCDQDFFGSYLDDRDYGVVAYANHQQVPGKKAWTWGRGSYGTMHQMDLTDADGPYNEVQTGPLRTQADVGRLDPSEVVSWQEWWYPVHRIGGFTFANRDLAVNSTISGDQLRLRLLGTGTWDPATVKVTKDNRVIGKSSCKVSVRSETDLSFNLGGAQQPFEVEVQTPRAVLARFRVPLDLPVRKPPAKSASASTPSEWVQAGWQDFLFARFAEAEKQFRRALEKDPKSVGARTGLAYLNLDKDPAQAAQEATSALSVDPDHGPAHYALAVAEFRLEHTTAALDHAWKACLDPASAVPGRALAAKILARQANWTAVIQAMTEPGPWANDPVCRNCLALAYFQTGDQRKAVELAELNLAIEPLDGFARALLDRCGVQRKNLELGTLLTDKPEAILDVVSEFVELGQTKLALELLNRFAPALNRETPSVASNPP